MIIFQVLHILGSFPIEYYMSTRGDGQLCLSQYESDDNYTIAMTQN